MNIAVEALISVHGRKSEGDFFFRGSDLDDHVSVSHYGLAEIVFYIIELSRVYGDIISNLHSYIIHRIFVVVYTEIEVLPFATVNPSVKSQFQFVELLTS